MAAKNGHIKMVKYLYEVMEIEPAEYSANWAAENGHLEIVDYLITLDLFSAKENIIKKFWLHKWN